MVKRACLSTLALLMTVACSPGVAPAPAHVYGRAPAPKPRPKVRPAPRPKPAPSTSLPTRRALEVRDVVKAYSVNWVVPPAEEPRGDHRVSNAPETDIRAVSVANDRRRIRIDIALHNPVSFTKKVIFAARIYYKGDVSEGFLFSPHQKKLMYVRFQGQKVVSSRQLKTRVGSDWVEIVGGTVRGVRKPNSIISLFIDKDVHFAKKDYGKRKWLRAQFFTGFIRKGDGQLRPADETRRIKLSYIR